MIGTTVLSLVILLASLQIADYRAYWRLPDEVRAQVPPPRLSFLLSPMPPGAPDELGRDSSAGGERGSVHQQALSFEERRALQERAVLAGMFLAAGLTVVLALLLSRSIARPIAAVSLAAESVAAGTFSTRVPLTERQTRSRLETHRLAVTFNQMSEALETYERERKAMVADIAHEFRTPLAGMQMRLEAIQDGLVPMSAGEAGQLLRQITVLSRLVDDLRTLSLADAGRLALNRQAADMSDLAQEVVQTFEPQAKERQVALRSVGPPLTAVVDQARVMQILGNLLDNALRMTPAGGEVSLSVSGKQGEVCLEVRDGGPGIPAADLPHVFERFVQGKDTKGSSGLGLAIVDALVKLHGGSVEASNCPEGGASFRVHLPLRAA